MVSIGERRPLTFVGKTFLSNFAPLHQPLIHHALNDYAVVVIIAQNKNAEGKSGAKKISIF